MKKSLIQELKQLKKGNIHLYNNIIENKYGKKLSWKEIEDLPENDFWYINRKLRGLIALKKSIIDKEKLKNIIHQSFKNFNNLIILVDYNCKLCGNKSDNPGICLDCANDMSEKIIFNNNHLYTITKIDDQIIVYPNDNEIQQSIQNSESGIGGSAITTFICKFCTKEDSWVNTSTPGICDKCAYIIANYISNNFNKILKNNYKNIINNKTVVKN